MQSELNSRPFLITQLIKYPRRPQQRDLKLIFRPIWVGHAQSDLAPFRRNHLCRACFS